MSFPEYLVSNYDDLLLSARDHLFIVVISIVLGTLVALALGILTYRSARGRTIALGVTGTILTIPSLALYTLLVVFGLGLGTKPVVVALTLYSLLPIVRNTITGLLGVDPAIVGPRRAWAWDAGNGCSASSCRWPGPSSSRASACPRWWSSASPRWAPS